MDKDKKILLADSKIKRLQERLRFMEEDGDEEGYENIENQLSKAIDKLNEVQSK